MVVRWLGMEIRVLRAFPNLVVIIAIVSTSAGLLAPIASHERGENRDLVQVLCVLFVLLISVLFSVPLHFADSSIKTDHAAPEVALAAILLLVLSCCIYILFKLLGKLLAAEFDKLKPIVAYSANLLGSIAGGISFMIISWLCVPPYYWLALVGFVVWLLYRRIYVIGITVFCVAATAISYSGAYFSPYSKITLMPAPEDVQAANSKDCFFLNSNNLFFNAGLDVAKVDHLDEIKDTEVKGYFNFCLPVFFGSFIFSICFKTATSNIAYLSANLIGVVIGGLTENICMFTGIKALGIIALFVYGMAYICWKIGQRSISPIGVKLESSISDK
jgi:hypothetical protein